MIERLRADIRIAGGNVDAGLSVYRDAMVRFPLHMGLLYGYGGALLAGARRFDESLRFSEAQLQNYPDDVRLHKLRTESYAGLGGERMQHQFAGSSVYACRGRPRKRCSSWSLLKAGDANFYELSSIDARLRELKQRQILRS
jgi:predicted Zn-dependent protease